MNWSELTKKTRVVCNPACTGPWQVVFEGQRAVGVDFVRYGRKRRVRARREVIVSAGAVGSPHILQLSGVGPRKHLEKLKVRSIFL